MRRLLSAFALVFCAQVDAQFIENPDFSDGLSGWQGSCCDLGPGFVGPAVEFPPGTDWCPACTPVTGLMQEVPYEFSFWARKTGSYIFGWAALMGFQPGGPYCSLDEEPSFSAMVNLSMLFNEEWALLSTPFTIPSFVPADLSYSIVLAPNNSVDADFSSIFFDEFAIHDLSTAIAPSTGSSLRHRPDPANDLLWVDLHETPLSITAIDVSGRTHDMKNFAHAERTLTLDVNALPEGICLLRLTTASGTRIVRFIKA